MRKRKKGARYSASEHPDRRHTHLYSHRSRQPPSRTYFPVIPTALIILAFISFIYYTSAVREKKIIAYDQAQLMNNLFREDGLMPIIRGGELDSSDLIRLSSMGYSNIKSQLKLHTDFAFYIVEDNKIVPLNAREGVLCFGSRRMKINGKPCATRIDN